jgi:hypothetical protein
MDTRNALLSGAAAACSLRCLLMLLETTACSLHCLLVLLTLHAQTSCYSLTLCWVAVHCCFCNMYPANVPDAMINTTHLLMMC